MLRYAHYGHPDNKKRYKKALKLQKNNPWTKHNELIDGGRLALEW
jgi:hypothetical protein